MAKKTEDLKLKTDKQLTVNDKSLYLDVSQLLSIDNKKTNN